MNTNKHESEEGIKLAGIFIRVHSCLPRRRHCEGGFIRGAPVVSLAQTQCAALIESMFGVTTSDDYRPVAWMGRYPVDVTTMLVGRACCGRDSHRSSLRHSRSLGADPAWDLIFNSIAQQFCPAAKSGAFSPTRLSMLLRLGLLWFAVEMYMLFVFGREVGTLHRAKRLRWLYLVLLLANDCDLDHCAGSGIHSALAGSPALHFASLLLLPRSILRSSCSCGSWQNGSP